MNYEREELKISIPLIDDIELQRINTFYNDIVSEYTKSFVKEKEQVIVQRLMMNLQQENSRLKEELEELKHKHYLIQGGRGNGKTYLLHLQQENKKLKEVIDKSIEYIESKNNGHCIINGEEKGAFTFILNFDAGREFIWKLLDILKGVE